MLVAADPGKADTAATEEASAAEGDSAAEEEVLAAVVQADKGIISGQMKEPK